MRRIIPVLLVAALAACGGTTAETFSEIGDGLPTVEPSESPTPEPTPSPTPDERAAYQDAVCDVIDPLVMAVGEQMGPALDALADDDAQAAARERAQLDVLVDDLLAAMESGPNYAEARTMETRLAASVRAFQDGLDAYEEGSRNLDPTAMQEATGLFEVSSELFAEAVTEFASVC